MQELVYWISIKSVHFVGNCDPPKLSVCVCVCFVVVCFSSQCFEF